MNRLPVAERRGQLVEAALAVASRDGIEAATVRAVAAEAGVSLGVVHYCFQDKDELLRAMATAITTENTPPCLDEMPDGLSVEPALELAVKAVWQAITADRGLQLLSYELTTSSLRHEELNQVAIEQYRGQWSSAESVLDAVAQKVGIRWSVPVQVLARSVIATIDGFALAWLVDGDDAAAGAGLEAFARHVATFAVPEGRTDGTDVPSQARPADTGTEAEVDDLVTSA